MSRSRLAAASTLLCVATCIVPATASADFTVTLPAGTFLLDSAYMHSTVNIQYGDDRSAGPLLKGIERYEPGGGWQGTITAKPAVVYRFSLTQLMYGITDDLTAAVAVPLVLDSTIRTNLSWRRGQYMSSLGRSYSEDDFWAWAQSMGQPKPPDEWKGNQNTVADIVLALRYRLPQLDWMKDNNIHWSMLLQGAVPTGTEGEPELLVTAGTTSWDLHSYADVETHVAMEKFWYDENGVTWLTVGFDAYYGWMRTRTYKTATGKNNPLLMTHQPYVGDTYEIDGGDWLAAQVGVDWAPIVGPTIATYITRGSMEKAQKLPRLLTFQFRYLYLKTGQTDWKSNSPLWEWDGREELWQPGDKQTFVFTGNISLLRVGAPLFLYARYRTQEILPGRNTRAANVWFFGGRLVAKFW